MHRDRRVPGHAGFPTVTGGCLMMVDRSTGTPHFQPGSQQLIAGIIAHMERTAKIPNPFCVPLENIKSWDCREHKIELGVKKACRYAAGLFIGANYSSTSMTTPEPTVRPFPIWLAKWEPCLFHLRRRVNSTWRQAFCSAKWLVRSFGPPHAVGSRVAVEF